MHNIDFFPVAVLATTDHTPDPLLAHPALRIARADQIKTGDIIVSAFDGQHHGRPATDYFASGSYPANPEAYDPTCLCGVCGLENYPTGAVVLTTGFPWDTCDPHPADALLLILPFYDAAPLTLAEVAALVQGEEPPARRYDTWSVESFRHYLTTGAYLPAPDGS